jgi:hypothetical protein
MKDDGAPKNEMALGPFGPIAGLSHALKETDRRDITAIVAIRERTAGFIESTPLADVAIPCFRFVPGAAGRCKCDAYGRVPDSAAVGRFPARWRS